MSPKVLPMIQGDILIAQYPTVCELHASLRHTSYLRMLHLTLCENLIHHQLFLPESSQSVPLDLEETEILYIVLI